MPKSRWPFETYEASGPQQLAALSPTGRRLTTGLQQWLWKKKHQKASNGLPTAPRACPLAVFLPLIGLPTPPRAWPSAVPPSGLPTAPRPAPSGRPTA